MSENTVAKTLPEQFKWAVITALKEAKSPYAQTYLRALPLSYNEYGDDGVRVQLLYVLSNLQTYRGENAREIKKIFKATIKYLENK